jgi:hypothetical protein
MGFGVPFGQLAWLMPLIVAGYGDRSPCRPFGIGGGGIIVPILFEVFRALGVFEEVRLQLLRRPLS